MGDCVGGNVKFSVGLFVGISVEGEIDGIIVG